MDAHKTKRKSISRKVSLGLGVMVSTLALISLMSLYGFFSLSAGLRLLSKESVPQIVEGALVTSSINSLLTETERLLAARNEPTRRSSYSKITDNIKNLREVIQGSSIADETMKSRIVALNETLSELNELVSTRIETTGQTEKSVGRLFAFAEELGATKVTSNGPRNSDESRSRMSDWNTISMKIVNLSGKAKTLQSLYKVKRLDKELQKLFKELDGIASEMSSLDRQKTQAMAQRLKVLVLGSEGVIPLVTLQVETTLQYSGRGNFARNLVEDTTSTLITAFNKQLSEISKRTNAITQQGNMLALSFSVLAFISFTAALLVVMYFRKNVINRLIDLNASILAKVNGQEVEIKQTGNDEITDMAQSFLFYEGEVSSREEKLIELAMKDSLTGAGNRRYFMQKGAELLAVSSRFDHELALLMMDIDYFKNVNDTYGHQVGDEVLKKVSETCNAILRNIDVFGRIGGEEFAAIFPETSMDGAMIAAEKIRSEIAKETWTVEGHKINCSVSIGVVRFDKGRSDDLDAMMKRADDALYEAKESGRNCIRQAV